MAKQRFINTKFWDDRWVVSLKPLEKLLFLYLITNPLTSIAGSYEISVRRIAFDTGLEPTMISKSLSKFEAEGRLIYRDEWILICNFIKNQSRNPKVVKGIEVAVSDSPGWVKDTLAKGMDSLSKPTIYLDSDSDSNLDSNSDSDSDSDLDVKPRKTPSASEINPTFVPLPQDEQRLKTECPTVNFEIETRNFIDHYLGNGEKGKDWNARWRKWIRNQHKWNLERSGNKPTKTTEDDLLSPDYHPPPAPITFEVALMIDETAGRLETYDDYLESRAFFLERDPGNLSQIEEYERSGQFRERFGEAGQVGVGIGTPSGRGNGNGQTQTAMPVSR